MPRLENHLHTPVRVPLGDGFDEIAQSGVLADGAGEADIRLAADRDHGVGVEPAVGPHSELSAGPGVAHPAHRFTQEVGGAPSRVGAARAQSGHQHVAGSSGDGQQRVIAQLAGVAVAARPLIDDNKECLRIASSKTLLIGSDCLT